MSGRKDSESDLEKKLNATRDLITLGTETERQA